MGLNQPFITIDEKNYTSEELSGMLLKHIKEDTEKVLETTIDEAVITVPAYFYSKEREATMQAAKFANLKVRKIINEPSGRPRNY
jgi:molecular chaperone DnaK